jgi:hypothetical protein
MDLTIRNRKAGAAGGLPFFSGALQKKVEIRKAKVENDL